MSVAIVVALLVQAKADEVIAAVEKKAADAKSVRWTATLRVAGAADEKLSVDCFFAGARLRCVAKGTLGGRDLDLLIVCDGATVFTDDGTGGRKQAAGKDMAARFRTAFLRGGAVGSLFVGGGPPDEWKPELVDAALEKDEKLDGRAVRVVTCRLAMGAAPKIAQKLWVDAEKSVLLKRTVEAGGLSVEETFSGVEFDGELEESLFKIP